MKNSFPGRGRTFIHEPEAISNISLDEPQAMNSTFIHEQLQDLRDQLDRAEAERDELLLLLHEVSEAETSEELEDILVRVREITVTRGLPRDY